MPVTDIGPSGGGRFILGSDTPSPLFPRRSIVAQSDTLWYTFPLCHEHQRAPSDSDDATGRAQPLHPRARHRRQRSRASSAAASARAFRRSRTATCTSATPRPSCIDFGLAREFGGTCNLRFDDTNPTTEDVEYVDAIQADIRWLGFEWDNLYYASDYFEQLYQYAEKLIQKGVAYVDSLNEEEIREYRGDYYKKGKESPYRNRSVEENLDLFRRMRAGEFKEGEHVLRAKIDLNSQNMNLRDPLLYRIRYAKHHRTGNTWCIYPLYDYAHPLSDAIEKITHSICTLEFEAHRPLYDWCIREAGAFPSQQIEFARGNLTYTVMSKRKLLELVKGKHVDGWDDPRMPTLAGLRRRGYTPEAIRAFWERVGVAKADSTVDVGLLEHTLREDLKRRCKRVMAVLRPLKLVIDNLPEGEVARARRAAASRTIRRRGRARFPFRASSTSSATTSATDRAARSGSAWRRGARCGCATPRSSVRRRQARRAASRRAARHDGSAVVGRHLARRAHGATARCTGCRRRTPSTPRCGSTIGSSPSRTRARPRARASSTSSTRDSLERVQAKLEPCAGDGGGGRDRAVRAARLLPARRGGRLEPRGHPQGHVGQDREEAAARAAKKAEKKVERGRRPGEIGIEEFGKVDLRVGLVKEAGLVEGADKLIRVMVDLGEGRDRQIFAGLRASYPDPTVLVGRRVVVVANLKPRQMKFGLSEGMILAAGKMVLAADESAKPGDKVS